MNEHYEPIPIPDDLRINSNWEPFFNDDFERPDYSRPNLTTGFVFDGDAPIEPPPSLVKGLVPMDGICFIGGQSGAGKTFIVCDLAVSLASGQPFFGRKVRERVGVAILAGEGSSTLAARLQVARDHKTDGAPLPIAWLGAVPNLADPQEVERIIPRLNAIGDMMRQKWGVRLGAVIFDTLAATFAVADENDNSEASRITRSLRNISDATDAVMIPVHHFGKGAETGLRGASAWRANCDSVISVLAERSQITGEVSDRKIALAKSRVGEEGPIGPFTLQFVQLGTDEDGEAFGSCFVKPGEANHKGEASSPKARLSNAAAAYLNCFERTLCDHRQRIKPFHDGPEVDAVDRELIRAEFYRTWPADGDTEQKRANAKRQRFFAAEQELVRKQILTMRELADKSLVWRNR